MTEKEAAALFGAFFQPTGKFDAWRYGVGKLADTEAVCAITHGELVRYVRAYNRQVSEGALRRVTVKEYLAFLEKDRIAGEKAAKDADAKRKAIEAEAAKKVKE